MVEALNPAWTVNSKPWQVLPANTVRRAEWSEGRLRLLCELADGQTEASPTVAPWRCMPWIPRPGVPPGPPTA